MPEVDVGSFFALPYWIEHWWVPYVVFLISLILTYLVLLTVQDRDNIFLRVVDLVVVCGAALSLIASTSDASSRFDPVRLELFESRYEFFKRELIHRLEFLKSHHCHMAKNATRTAYSPDNFDELVAEDAMLCTWASGRLSEALKLPEQVVAFDYESALSDFPDLKLDLFNPYDGPWSLAEIDSSLQQVISEYSKFYESRRDFFQRHGFAVYSPLFIAVFFGIALARSLRVLWIP